MKIRGFSYATGSIHRDLMTNICLRSVRQSKNAQALARCSFVWDLYTDDPTWETPAEFDIRLLPATIRNSQRDVFTDMKKTLMRCYENGEAFLLLLPDIFLGDGSIASLIDCAYVDDTCIAAPHLRVLHEDFLENMPAGDISNERLVSLSLKHLHRSWTQAEVHSNPSSTYNGGILIKRLAPPLYVVQHMLPNYFLARFTESDVEYFKTAIFRDWDWRWPEKIVRENRHRVLCSSDLFFAAELTEADKNVPEMVSAMPVADAFFEDRLHNQVNRFMVCTLRGES